MTPSEQKVATEPLRRLRRLWDRHRRTAVPGGEPADPKLQEVLLYQSWLGTLIEAAIANGGTLSRQHQLMLDVRRAEGNQALWLAAAELGEPVRSYVARLLELEELLASLPAA